MPDLQSSPEPDAVEPALRPSVFRCVMSHCGHDAAWVRLSGELDLAGAPELEQCLRDAVSDARLVIVDLRELIFIDSAGVHLIIGARDHALRIDRRLVLVKGSGQITRLFELVELTRRLEFVKLGSVASKRSVPAPVKLA